MRLSDEEISAALASDLSKWSLDGDFIRRQLVFADFREAWSFMNEVALSAESMNHHPNWENVYNRVDISLSTHDSNGLTQLDLDLALQIEACLARRNHAG